METSFSFQTPSSDIASLQGSLKHKTNVNARSLPAVHQPDTPSEPPLPSDIPCSSFSSSPFKRKKVNPDPLAGNNKGRKCTYCHKPISKSSGVGNNLQPPTSNLQQPPHFRLYMKIISTTSIVIPHFHRNFPS